MSSARNHAPQAHGTKEDSSTGDLNDVLSSYYIGGIVIKGDIMSPVVPYEDYTFDENNICPEAWAKRQAASKTKRRKSK